MPPDSVRIEHRYPEARVFLRAHGSDALALLDDLLTQAEWSDGTLVARTSIRKIAERLQIVSKDTVHRRLRELIRAGVIEPVGRHAGSSFIPTSYVLHLDHSGIAVLPDGPDA